MIPQTVLRRSILLAMGVAGLTTGAFAQEGTLAGHWEGAITLQGAEIPMEVDFVDGEALTATIDVQGAAGVPLRDVTHEDGQVHFELSADPGVAVFDGKLEGDVIEGAFTQAGYTGTFQLTRSAGSG